MTEDNRVVGAVLLLVVLSVVLVASVWGVAAALDDSGAQDRVTNETVTQNGDWTSLQADADRYVNETVTYNDNTLNRTEHYQWNADTGEIRFLDHNETVEGDDATIDYSTIEYPGSVAAFMSVLAPLFEVGGVLPLVVGAGSVLYGVGWLQKSRGRW